MSSLEKAKKKKKDELVFNDTDMIIIPQPNDKTIRKSREPKGNGEYVTDMAGNYVVPTFI